MENVVTSLTTTLSASALWGIVGEVVPFLAIAVLFALGFRLVYSIVKSVRSKRMGVK